VAERGQGMTQWAYRIQTFPPEREPELILLTLNSLGRQGWEAWCKETLPLTGQVRVWLRRDAALPAHPARLEKCYGEAQA
jgi:hypothetical protein